MTIQLQRLALTGEVAYIAKHNSNIETTEAAINTLQGTVDTLQNGAASPINAINVGRAMFGAVTVALVGVNSFASSTSGSNLTLQPGFFWNASSGQMTYKSNTTVISFSGAAAATYYIRMGVDGIPYRDSSSASALYSVVWTGSAFGTITKLATYAVGYDDLIALLGSSYSGLTYTTPDLRIEATEKAFSALLTKTVTTADVTLTTAEAMESGVIRVSGALTAARNLIVPAKAKVYLIDNDTTGAFTLTVKTASGTGVALSTGDNAALYCDGTNVAAIFAGAGGGGGATAFTGLSDAPASYSGQANKIVKVKADESGLEFSSATAPGVFTGLSDVPASYTGQAGKVPVVKGDETGLEFGAAVSTFTALTDTPADYAGMAYRVVTVKGDETGLEYSAAATPSSLLGLTDTPSSYSGMALRVLRVNAAGTAVEFTDEIGGSTVNAFTDLSDVPTNYATHSLKFVRVNAAANALEFASLDLTTFLGLTDTPTTYAGAAYKVISVKGDESGVEFSEMATPTSFIGLTDAPTTYTGHGGKKVKVTAGATGLEFVVDDFLSLAGTPDSFSGQALKGVRVNTDASGLEFYDSSEGGAVQGAYRGTFGNPSLPKNLDFETGSQPEDFTDSATNGWTVVSSADPIAGTTKALLSKDLTYNQTSDATFSINVVGGGGDLVVRYDTNGFSVHGNPIYWDKFSILVDAVEAAYTQVTTSDYTSFTVPVTAGVHTVKLRLYNNFDLQTCEVRVSHITYPMPDPDSTYKYGDVVDYSGNRYLCLVAGTLAAPTVAADWQLLPSVVVNDFIGLSDTPASYSGQALKGVRVNAAGDGLEFYNHPAPLVGAWNGTIPASTVIMRVPLPFATTFSANFAGSYAVAEVAATAQTDFDVQDDGVSIGTLRFAAAAAVGTFILASETTVAEGSVFKLVAPATPDATLAGLGITFAGRR